MSLPTATPAAEMREQLEILLAERAAAELEGLREHPQYSAMLEEEIAAARSAYVGAAVTEIATLRGQLSGPLEG